MGARSVYGGRHLDRPVAFYKLSWLEKQTEGEGSRRVGERKENEEGNRINAQSCRFKHRGFHKLALITRES